MRIGVREIDEAEAARRDPAMPEGYEADPELFACPDGPYCRDPECVRTHRERILCLTALLTAPEV